MMSIRPWRLLQKSSERVRTATGGVRDDSFGHRSGTSVLARGFWVATGSSFATLMLTSLWLVLWVSMAAVSPSNAQPDEASSKKPPNQRVGTAILIDVSLSMSDISANNWKQDVRTFLTQVIQDGTIDQDTWQIDGLGQEFAEDLRSGNVLHQTGEPLFIAEIGEVSPTPPYLDRMTMERPTTPVEAARQIERVFPSRFNDQWTYIDLALEVTRQRMLKQGVWGWYLIIVSDMDQDYDDSGKVQQDLRRIANQYGVGLRSEKRAALAYRNDTSLRISINFVESLTDPCDAHPDRPSCDGPEVAAEGTGQVRLRLPEAGAVILPDEAPTFRWQAPTKSTGFELVLRDEEKIYGRYRRQNRLLQLQDPLPEGQYEWHVVGFSNGERIRSPESTFVVQADTGSYSWLLYALLSVIAVLLVGYLAYAYLPGSKAPRTKEEKTERIDLS